MDLTRVGNRAKIISSKYSGDIEKNILARNKGVMTF